MTTVLFLKRKYYYRKESAPYLWKTFSVIGKNILTFGESLEFNSIRFHGLVFFVFFCFNFVAFAQYDPQFSQNMFNPLPVNAGYAGFSGRTNAVIINRTQWVGIEGAPKTTVVGADMAVNFLKNKGGVGLVVMNDEIGFFQNITIQGVLAQRYDLGEGELGVGVNLGLVNQSFDGSKVILKPAAGGDYHQPTDQFVPTTDVNGFAFDMGLGAWYSRPDYYLGFSILHLFAPKPNFKEELDVYIPRSFFLTGGYNYKFWEKPIELQPSVFLKQSAGSWQMDLNVNLMFQQKYWTGLTYRLQDAIVLFAGMELKSGIKIGYSYDITTSALSKAGSNGSHEVMVGYTFDISTEKREKRYKSVRYL